MLYWSYSEADIEYRLENNQKDCPQIYAEEIVGSLLKSF